MYLMYQLTIHVSTTKKNQTCTPDEPDTQLAVQSNWSLEASSSVRSPAANSLQIQPKKVIAVFICEFCDNKASVYTYSEFQIDKCIACLGKSALQPKKLKVCLENYLFNVFICA